MIVDRKNKYISQKCSIITIFLCDLFIFIKQRSSIFCEEEHNFFFFFFFTFQAMWE